MRVLFVSFEYPPRIIGGAGTYAESLVSGFEERGIDVRIITSQEIERYDPKEHGVFASNASHWQRFHLTRQALRLSRSKKFDVVHFNGLYSVVRGLRLPTVCTLHCSQFTILKTSLRVSRKLETVDNIMDLVLRQPLLCLFDALMVRVADKIICPSPSLARALSYYGVDNRKIHVIQNGINLERFDRTQAFDNDLLKEYRIEKEKFILYIGRLAPIKGVEYLVDAFKSIKKECADLKLVIAGNGAYKPYLEKSARDIEDVVFLGFISSPSVKKLLYENCLVLVVPSLTETFPLVPLEAMACSKPIVATNVGGVPLMVRPGKNGILVRAKNSKDLAKCITMLYQAPDLRRKMGKSGREMVEKEFTVARMVSETIKVYEGLL